MSVKQVILNRNSSNPKQTLGHALVYDESGTVIFSFLTLELPLNANKKNISCIPTGIYKVVRRISARFGNHFHVLNVPNRSFILFHSGNFISQTKGCILVGRQLQQLNSDGLLDVTNSVATLKILWDLCPNGFELIIY